MTVGELEARMSEAEYRQWAALEQLKAEQQDRADQRTRNKARKKGRR